MSRFGYIIDKVGETDFIYEPFKHLYIPELFSPEDFFDIINSPEINTSPSSNDEELFDTLFRNGYKIIEFPGCITSKRSYIDWHSRSRSPVDIHSACEGFGMTLRLFEAKSDIIRELNTFISSDKFNMALAEKCQISFDACHRDNGIQKYLDGYEISPHPDIRKKALTFMVNINPDPRSEENEHHTHYLKFKDERRHIQEFWEENKGIDRCWVPWDWCEITKTQTTNNSFVLFAPASDTLHAIKAKYNHLISQRTQLYGNMWYNQQAALKQREWEDFEGIARRRLSMRQMVKKAAPAGLLHAVRTARWHIQSAELGGRSK